MTETISKLIHNVAEKLHLASPVKERYELNENDKALANTEPAGPVAAVLSQTKLKDVIPKNQDLVMAFEELNACGVINVCTL